MAVKKTAKATATTEAKGTGKIIGIKELSEKFQVEGKDLRAFLRKQGYKAPEITDNAGTFGPRAKYSWEEGTAEYNKVVELIQKSLEEPEAEEAAK